MKSHFKRPFCSPCALGCALMMLAVGACKPNYPKCDGDDACKDRGEVCLNGQCQECRDAVECDAKYPGEGRLCRDGRCDARTSCHADTDCAALGAAMVCRSGTCVPECTGDADCSLGQHCDRRHCVVSSCSSAADCPAGQACVSGLCAAASVQQDAIPAACRAQVPGDAVQLDPIHFEFNRYELTEDARAQLHAVLACMKLLPAAVQVVVEGHCDDRGTQEYNLALGEKRAHAVMSYFKQMGLDARRFHVRSKGENEPLCTEATEACFNQNRRVQFLQQR